SPRSGCCPRRRQRPSSGSGRERRLRSEQCHDALPAERSEAVSAFDSVERGFSRGSVNPLWWRIPSWAAIAGATAAAAHGTPARIVTLVLMLAAAVAVQFVRHPDARVRAAA